MTDNATLAKRIAELERQLSTTNNSNQELTAQVEALREALNDQLNDCINFDGGKLTDAIMKHSSDLLAATPQQHLAEIRAQAGRNGFFKGVAWILDIDVKDISAMVVEEAAKQYADSIRQEKK